MPGSIDKPQTTMGGLIKLHGRLVISTMRHQARVAHAEWNSS
jgi:hypothetical protein